MSRKGHARGRRRGKDLLTILALLLALAPTTARAHKVTVFAWVEGDTVYTESRFSGGRQAKDARIEVYNTAGEKLLEGRTDDQGRFAFKPPRPQALRVVLIAGAGHRNEWRVAAEEFGDTPPVGTPAAASPSPTETAPRVTTAAQAPMTLSRAELQALIEVALDKKLAPIHHRLGTLDSGPSLPEIIGGIGYIIGLVGLAAYLQSRRRSG